MPQKRQTAKKSKTKKKSSQIAIITVTGIDKVGIIARLATAMAKANINIVDVNQKIMEDYFVMTMAADMQEASVDMAALHKSMDKMAHELDLRITVQDENIFVAMHRI